MNLYWFEGSGGTVSAFHKKADVDDELTRLRERVGELESEIEFFTRGSGLIKRLTQQSVRIAQLNDAVRWFMTCGVISQTGNSVACQGRGIDYYFPAHLAPLIAEAVRDKP